MHTHTQTRHDVVRSPARFIQTLLLTVLIWKRGCECRIACNIQFMFAASTCRTIEFLQIAHEPTLVTRKWYRRHTHRVRKRDFHRKHLSLFRTKMAYRLFRALNGKWALWKFTFTLWSFRMSYVIIYFICLFRVFPSCAFRLLFFAQWKRWSIWYCSRISLCFFFNQLTKTHGIEQRWNWKVHKHGYSQMKSYDFIVMRELNNRIAYISTEFLIDFVVMFGIRCLYCCIRAFTSNKINFIVISRILCWQT